MALTVEDGTGLAAADSWVTLVEATTWHSDMGNTTWASGTYDDTQREAALRRAARFLSDSFAWIGYPTNNRTQNLAWPRFYVSDEDNLSIASDEIPVEIKRAQFEVALEELVTPRAMSPTVTLSNRVKMEQVGPLKVEYLSSYTSAFHDRPQMLSVLDMITQFMEKSSGNAKAGVSVRI